MKNKAQEHALTVIQCEGIITVLPVFQHCLIVLYHLCHLKEERGAWVAQLVKEPTLDFGSGYISES